ncbi:hypothetical protein GCM10010236_55720 [Streptomyces eurythermus]|nr:hypothetical protein GCM10010236_55720 [Streptomyces eurythermus]
MQDAVDGGVVESGRLGQRSGAVRPAAQLEERLLDPEHALRVRGAARTDALTGPSFGRNRVHVHGDPRLSTTHDPGHPNQTAW